MLCCNENIYAKNVVFAYLLDMNLYTISRVVMHPDIVKLLGHIIFNIFTFEGTLDPFVFDITVLYPFIFNKCFSHC
jgi:hypothetical protein